MGGPIADPAEKRGPRMSNAIGTSTPTLSSTDFGCFAPIAVIDMNEKIRKLSAASRLGEESGMNLNQVTVTMPDLDEGWTFYCALGLVPVVDARPDYVRFVCPDGNSTFSLHKGGDVSAGTTVYFECDDLDEKYHSLTAAGIAFSTPPQDQSWLWREAELFDPGGNRILLYLAGSNRINPPWRIQSDQI